MPRGGTSWRGEAKNVAAVTSRAVPLASQDISAYVRILGVTAEAAAAACVGWRRVLRHRTVYGSLTASRAAVLARHPAWFDDDASFHLGAATFERGWAWRIERTAFCKGRRLRA